MNESQEVLQEFYRNVLEKVKWNSINKKLNLKCFLYFLMKNLRNMKVFFVFKHIVIV
jgi:hypothetical protein